MSRVIIVIDTDLPAEAVHAALIDFSPRRPELWPSITPSTYEVYEIGDTWAEIREGSGDGSSWARQRYDWSQPGRVIWTVVESGYAMPGDFTAADISERDGGGSRIRLEWQRRGTHLTAKLMVGMIALMRGLPVKRSFEAGLKAIAAARLLSGVG